MKNLNKLKKDYKSPHHYKLQIIIKKKFTYSPDSKIKV